MPLMDRFKRLRRGSVSADNSPPSVSAHETDISTGEQTPAMTKTPTAQSHTDLTTVGEVLTHQATLKAQAEGVKKKKRRGLFRRKDDPYKDWPEDVYKPHEVPAPKYKRTPDPKHVENLSAFSFGGTASKFMRRLSMQSGVSPGGSKHNSRAPSRINSIAPSQTESRNASVADGAPEDGGVVSPSSKTAQALRPGAGNRIASRPTTKADVAKHVERIGEEDESAAAAGSDKENAAASRHLSRDSNDMPFTPQELTHALSKANVSSDRTQPVGT